MKLSPKSLLTFNNAFTFLAFALGLTSFIRDGCQDRRLDRLNYDSQGMQFRPHLSVTAPPRLSHFNIKSKYVSLYPTEAGNAQGDTLVIPTELSIRFNLILRNDSETQARVFAWAWKDTTSGEPKLREMISDEKLRKRFALSPAKDFFSDRDIQPGDSTSFALTRQIAFMGDDTFTMHFLFFYANDIGAIFDTYYWARYKTNLDLIAPEVIEVNGKKALRVRKRLAVSELVRILDENESSHFYSKDDASKIIDFYASKSSVGD